MSNKNERSIIDKFKRLMEKGLSIDTSFVIQDDGLVTHEILTAVGPDGEFLESQPVLLDVPMKVADV